jgi:hypothetical protein
MIILRLGLADSLVEMAFAVISLTSELKVLKHGQITEIQLT